MGKYPLYRRWVVSLPPAQRRPYLRQFSARLARRLQEVDSYLLGEIDEVPGFPAPEEVILVPDSPPFPVQNVQPGEPIVISDDEEPLADIEDLLKTSDEEDAVKEDVVTDPPFSFSELDVPFLLFCVGNFSSP